MQEQSGIEGKAWRAGDAVLTLEHGRVSGTGGVNRVMGEYRLEGTTLVFGPLATTMMAGPPERMEQERQLLALLARVGRWALDEGELVLLEPEGSALLRLQPDAAA